MFDLFQSSSSSDLTQQRRRMVDDQLRARGIHNERVLAAMAKVPREEFVFPEDRGSAYDDHPLPIGSGQTISQPYIVAAMVAELQIDPRHRLLEVGTGTGYEAAILGELAAEVWTIERQSELADRAREILSRLGYVNVCVLHGDGTLGAPEHAPFDGILVAAAAPALPDSLLAQLAEGGRLVVPVGSRSEQQLTVARRVGNETLVSVHDLCRFVPLVGAHGWPI